MASLLVADDDPDIRFLLRRKVEAAAGPLSVLGEAASGDEAVEMWRRLRPDAIVLNQRMPGLSGLEAAALILGEHPGQVIILFTGFRDDDMCEKVQNGPDRSIRPPAQWALGGVRPPRHPGLRGPYRCVMTEPRSAS